MSPAADSADADEELRLERHGRVIVATLHRPDALNALTVRLKEALREAIEAAARDDDVGAIVLTGDGRAFCAGQDLRERLEPDALPLADEIRARYNPLVQAIRSCPKPVVAAVNGVAAGAGASLALACDIRIAADTASFVLAFGRIGLLPDSGLTWLLPRLIGEGRARALALLDEPVGADEALRIGLVDRVVPSADLGPAALDLATRLGAGAPRAIAATKAALDAAWDADLETQLETEARLQGELGATAEHAEGIAAFLERRPPRFSGR